MCGLFIYLFINIKKSNKVKNTKKWNMIGL
jgi:hypothetical protein